MFRASRRKIWSVNAKEDPIVNLAQAQHDVPQLSSADVAHYRRDGYLVIPGVLSPAHVEACKTALSDLMQERVPRTSTNL